MKYSLLRFLFISACFTCPTAVFAGDCETSFNKYANLRPERKTSDSIENTRDSRENSALYQEPSREDNNNSSSASFWDVPDSSRDGGDVWGGL